MAENSNDTRIKSASATSTENTAMPMNSVRSAWRDDVSTELPSTTFTSGICEIANFTCSARAVGESCSRIAVTLPAT
jgi:hypothetical protein